MLRKSRFAVIVFFVAAVILFELNRFQDHNVNDRMPPVITMEEDTVGRVRLVGCENVHAINELSIPILAVGLKDAVISASPDGILVSDKERSGYIKQYVDDIDQQVMFARKSWGNYRVLDVEKDSLTVKVSLKPNSRIYPAMAFPTSSPERTGRFTGL